MLWRAVASLAAVACAPAAKGDDTSHITATSAVQVALVGMWANKAEFADAPMPGIVGQMCASLSGGRRYRVSGYVVDLLIYVDDAAIAPPVCASGTGVNVVALGRGGVADAVASGLASGLDLDAASPAAAALRRNVSKVLALAPAYLVELKPVWLWALWHDLVRRGYTHATYTDFDIVLGDLDPWLTRSNPSEYDIVTWGFDADAVRVFARGQFSLFRLRRRDGDPRWPAVHEPPPALLRWVRCRHLSVDLPRRIELLLDAAERENGSAAAAPGGTAAAVPLGPEKYRRVEAPFGNNHRHFLGVCPTRVPRGGPSEIISAEACFSCAIFVEIQDYEKGLFRKRWNDAFGDSATVDGSRRVLEKPLALASIPFSSLGVKLDVKVVVAMFTDHVETPVYWHRGRLLRCTGAQARPNATTGCEQRLAAYRRPARTAPVVAEPVEIVRPCKLRMGWLTQSSRRGAACVNSTLDAGRIRAVVSDGRGERAEVEAASAADAGVVEAAMFHYRIWMDESKEPGGMDLASFDVRGLSSWRVTTRGFARWSPVAAGAARRRLGRTETPAAAVAAARARGVAPFEKPAVYFIGVSKCGTSSMIQYLLAHPLVAEVGVYDGKVGAEAHLMDKSTLPGALSGVRLSASARHFTSGGDAATLAADRAARAERHVEGLDAAERARVEKDGVVIEYTPHYSFVPGMPAAVCAVVAARGRACEDATKVIVMLREPARRTISSYFYHDKEGARGHASIHFLETLANGTSEAAGLERCVAERTGLAPRAFFARAHDVYVRKPYANPTEWAARNRSLAVGACTLELVQRGNCRFGICSHVGKSLYAMTLVHWLARVPRANLHVLALEDFAADAAARFADLVTFLGLPLFDAPGGLDGFASERALRDVLEVRYNENRPPASVVEVQIGPARALLDAFFLEPNAHLQLLLCGEVRDAPGVAGGSRADASWAAARACIARSASLVARVYTQTRTDRGEIEAKVGR